MFYITMKGAKQMKSKFLTKYQGRVLEVDVMLSRYLRGGRICLALKNTDPDKNEIIEITSVDFTDIGHDNCIAVSIEDHYLIGSLTENKVIESKIEDVKFNDKMIGIFKLTKEAYDHLNSVTKFIPHKTRLILA